jgi:hypothetical protein
VYEALLTQHGTRMPHTAICGLTALCNNFPQYLINGNKLEKMLLEGKNV